MQKRLILLLCYLLLSYILQAPPLRCLYIFKYEAVNYERLWKAVCEVESGNNPLAYNSTEKACGIAQVRQIRLEHYNFLTGENLVLNDMYDTLKAKRVFMYFCKGRDLEVVAKEWNGRGKMTENYWDKVKYTLQNIEN